jgi:nucleoid-associated protein YgaU
MGKFEKLVILTVLFAAAIVLAISFNRGDKKPEAESPLGGASKLLGEQTGFAQPETETAPTATEAPLENDAAKGSLFLNAGDETLADASVPTAAPTGLAAEPVSDRSARILGDTTGLRPSFLDDYMVYTVAEGDTWSALAQRFYQDGRFTRNLHQANEGMSSLVPGSEILVPVYDFVQPEAGLQPGNALVSDTSSATPAPASFVPPPETESVTEAPVVPPSGTLEYIVASGDTLSGIALAALGSAKRWPELLELNKDKLPKAEALKVGMKLKLPADARMPSASAKPVAKAEPKKTESKPTAKKETTEPAPKKKSKKVL